MRIANLSRRSGVPVATIKFYLRERLLPPGTPTARNQARYDDGHLTRLRLIRILIGIGNLSLSSVREVLTAIDTQGLPRHAVSQVVNRALIAERSGSTDPAAGELARSQVDELLAGLGWRVDQDAPGRGTLAQVLAALQHLGSGDLGVRPDGKGSILAALTPYADAAARLAVHEVDAMAAGSPVSVAAGTVLFEAAFAAMRHMANEHYETVHSGQTG